VNPSEADARARAERLVRWYPKEWRARYGDEFSELLAAHILEQPRSWVRAFDLCVGATTARLAALGLCGTTVEPSHQPRRSLATLGCALAVFLTVALSMWSHLTIAWRSAAPATTATHTAIVVMSAALTISLVAIVVGSLPIAGAAIRSAGRSEPRVRAPALLFLTATAALIGGALAFHHGWSSSAHSWSQDSAGPGGPASFIWVSTLTVSAYWAHPTILVALPFSEVAWMAVSPALLTLSVVGAAKTVRRLDLSARTVHLVTLTARLAIGGLALFLVGTSIWLVAGGPGPARLFQAGSVDRVGLVVMSVTLIVAVRSAQRTTAPRPTRCPPPKRRSRPCGRTRTHSDQLPSDERQVVPAQHPRGQGPFGEMIQGVVTDEVGDSRRGEPSAEVLDPLDQGGSRPAEQRCSVGIAFRMRVVAGKRFEVATEERHQRQAVESIDQHLAPGCGGKLTRRHLARTGLVRLLPAADPHLESVASDRALHDDGEAAVHCDTPARCNDGADAHVVNGDQDAGGAAVVQPPRP
jgi:hypothetical protein